MNDIIICNMLNFIVCGITTNNNNNNTQPKFTMLKLQVFWFLPILFLESILTIKSIRIEHDCLALVKRLNETSLTFYSTNPSVVTLFISAIICQLQINQINQYKCEQEKYLIDTK